MNYFVSIENNYQHSWQIELLIQSFKDKGVEDSLFVAVGLDDSFSIYDSKNLSNHNNKFYFKKASSNYSLNKWNSLLKLIIDNKEIFPLTVLNPYNIFCRDISFGNAQIVTSEDSFFTHNIIDEYFPGLFLDEDEVKKKWIKFGNTIVFNDLPVSFFEDILLYINFLLNKKEFLGIEKAALNLSVWKNYECFIKHSKELNIEVRKNSIESNMLENAIKNIINYDHGIQPSFSRIWFSKNDFAMHPDKPIECLSKLRHTRCLDFIADVAKNYIDENF